MQKLVIDGGRPLSGEIKVQGAKMQCCPSLPPVHCAAGR